MGNIFKTAVLLGLLTSLLIVIGGALGGAEVGEVGAEPLDLGLEMTDRAPARAAAREQSQDGRHAEGTIHPRRP